MIFCRKVRPSMRGISMSRVITSGICSRIRSAATNGSPAVAMTSISGSPDSTSLRVWRTTAESSTISTRILRVLMISLSWVRTIDTRQSSINSSNNTRGSRRSSTSPVLRIEPDAQPRGASQARRRHVKALGPHNLNRTSQFSLPTVGLEAAAALTTSTSAPPNNLTCTSVRTRTEFVKLTGPGREWQNPRSGVPMRGPSALSHWSGIWATGSGRGRRRRAARSRR